MQWWRMEMLQALSLSLTSFLIAFLSLLSWLAGTSEELGLPFTRKLRLDKVSHAV